MKKYLYIFKSEIMTSLQYTFDVITKLISYFLLIVIFVSLWKYIYSDPTQSINGYNMIQMVWYIIATELIWTTVGTRALTKSISNDIKSGGVIYKLNKPYDYILYNIASHLGQIVIKFIMFFIFAAIIGYVLIGSFPPISLPMIFIFLLSVFLSIILNIIMATFIGLLSFYIEDSGPLYWVYSKVILVLGTVIPLEFFPPIMAKILKYSPIVAISYGPGRLLVNFSYTVASKILLAQIVYIIIAFILTKLLYKKGVKKLNVNGG